MTATPRMKNQTPAKPKRPLSPEILKFMEEECKPVKGVFKNYECPGGTAQICMHKYPGQPTFTKTMMDGEQYEVPLWVARWLNGVDVTAKGRNGKIGSCSYPKYEYQLPTGSLDSGVAPGPVPMIGQFRQRYGFQSLDFSL